MKLVEKIPKDFPVRPLRSNQKAKDRMTCGQCGLSWDNGKVTGWTPTPSARCPFEYFHIYPEDDTGEQAMKKNLVRDQKTETQGAYTYSEIKIDLPVHDTDVELKLPNGQIISIQWRIESPSLDVCLPDDLLVTNWKGDELEAAPAFDGRENCTEQETRHYITGHVRRAKQLCIDFGPHHLVLPEQEE